MARTRKARPLPAYTADFERFWRAYPRRRPNPRPEACEAWHQALALEADGIGAEALIAAAERFAEECRREKVEAAFIPHARTWLHKRRFLDYLPSSLSPPGLTGGSSSPADEAPVGMALPGPPRLHGLLGHMTRTEYDAWIAPLKLRDRAGGGVDVVTPTPMHRDWVRNHYGDLLRRALGISPSWYTQPYNRRESDG